MKFSKGILAVVGLSLSSAALAQDAAVKAEKQAPIKTLLPGAYGKLSMRHYTTVTQDKEDKVVSSVPQVQARPMLGSTFFDGALDTSFEWVFVKKADTQTITRSDLINYTTLKAIEGKYGYFGLYGETYQKNGQSFDESYLGTGAELARDLDLGGATLSLAGYNNIVGVFKDDKTSRSSKVERENRTRGDVFGLMSEDEQKVEQQEPSIQNWTGVQALVMPAAAKNLSAGVGIDVVQDWTPKYVAVDNEEGIPVTEKDGYAVSGDTLTRLIVGYKISDKVSVQNQLRHFTKGVYQEGTDATAPRWQNRVYLNVSLF